MVQKNSPRGIHFRRAGPRQRVGLNAHTHPRSRAASPCTVPERDSPSSDGFLSYDVHILQVYFEPDEVRACIVTCGGLCPGLNTVIREIVCGLYDMYGVTKILGIEVSIQYFLLLTC